MAQIELIMLNSPLALPYAELLNSGLFMLKCLNHAALFTLGLSIHNDLNEA